jgi:hypothetical protein
MSRQTAASEWAQSEPAAESISIGEPAIADTDDDGVFETQTRDLRSARRALRRKEQAAITSLSATRLSDSARWSGASALLEVNVLLGPLLADRAVEYVAFTDNHFNIAIRTHTLRGVARLQSGLPELVAWVDRHGLHFRWGTYRGGYNWRHQPPLHRRRAAVLVVQLKKKVEEQQ